MSSSSNQQQSQTAVYQQPLLKLNVNDLTASAANTVVQTVGQYAAGGSLIGGGGAAAAATIFNPNIVSSAAAVGFQQNLRALNPMQIQQRSPSSAAYLAAAASSGGGGRNDNAISAASGGAAAILKSGAPPTGVLNRELYLSNFNAAGVNLSGATHLSPSSTGYMTVTSQPPQHPSTVVHNSSSSQAQFQRLKVEDALSYLDQVKLQFGSKPHVYNDFLDIMKEFKSQAYGSALTFFRIDTPGVIQRVSHLFRGHPNLIVGFNTFLPPGYKIEVHGECGERVSISTPSGQSHIIAPDEQLMPHSNHVNSGSGLVITSGSNNSNDNRASILMNGQNKTVAVQPLEFNHAISYVNKIKMRFINQPDVYKNFLEILHTYQKEQREIKEGTVSAGRRTLSEREVYDLVARLFANEEDLLREFSQFLPDATAQFQVQQAMIQPSVMTLGSGGGISNVPSSAVSSTTVGLMAGSGGLPPPNIGAFQQTGASMTSSTLNVPGASSGHHPLTGGASSTSVRNSPSNRSVYVEPPPATPPKQQHHVTSANSASPRSTASTDMVTSSSVIKRPLKDSQKDATSVTSSPPKKQFRREIITHNVNLIEAVTCGSLQEYEIFDKIKKTLKDEESYRNFLRFLILYNQEIISKTDLMQLIMPLFGKHLEFNKWFRDFLGCNEISNSACIENVPEKPKPEERIVSDLAMEIDYASCIRNGVSYRALPKSYVHPKSSGRTRLCDEVLNDLWVSFPSWQSEDTMVVSSKKSQYEENIYRTEDERFELDNVIETNNATIETLEVALKRMSAMTAEEAKHYQLDERLGGRSHALHRRVIRRIYGDKAGDVMEGLMKNPSVVVPIVLERLKSKDQEWREAKQGFNRIWREQNEKHYWKSLDHQGINFKQNDFKFIRSKALLNQIETLFDERHELLEEGVANVPTGPHLEVFYPKDGSVFYDVNDLLIHHVKRQAGMQKDEKHKIKKLLKVTLPQLFGMACETLSDDENESDDKEEDDTASNDNGNGGSQKSSRISVKRKLKLDLPTSLNNNNNNNNNSNNNNNNNNGRVSSCSDYSENSTKTCPALAVHNSSSKKTNEFKVHCGYSLMIFTNPWYVLLRLHHLLCERLAKLKSYANQLIREEKLKNLDEESKAAAEMLKSRPKSPCPPTEFYCTLIQLIKNVLDGQIDNVQFEDNLRDMFIIHAYIGFTMDKIVQTMVKQLQAIVTEDTCHMVNELYEKWCAAGGAASSGGSSLAERKNLEDQYQREAERLSTDQNFFKAYFYQEEQKVTFELLDTDSDETNDDLDVDLNKPKLYTCYALEFVKILTNQQPAASSLSSCSEPIERLLNLLAAKPIYLCRNVRRTKCFLNSLASKQSSRKNSKECPAGDAAVSVNDAKEKSFPEAVVTSSSSVICIDEQMPSTSTASAENLPTTTTTTTTTTVAHGDSGANEATPSGDALQQNESSPDASTTVANSNANVSPIKNRLKILYIQRSNETLYRRGALLRAQKTRLKSTEARNRRFLSWQERWTLANVSMEQARLTDDWFMGRSEEMMLDSSVCIQRMQEPCVIRPPFCTVYRYLSPQQQTTPITTLR